MPAFLFTSLVLFLLWLSFLLFSDKTRREQIIMSIVGLLLTPGIILIVSNDFRTSLSNGSLSIGIEDLLFTFALFGIASVVYQILLGQHTHKLKGTRLHMGHPVLHWFVHLVLILGIWAFLSLLFIDIFELASIRALIIGGLLVGTYIIADRHDLLFDALLTGLLTAMLVFVVEQIFFVRLFPDAVQGFWQFDAIRSFLIGGIPLEEILWSAVVGFTIGPMYEYLKRYRLS